MQRKDFFRRQPKQSIENLQVRQSSKSRWLISGGVLLLVVLVTGWLLSTGLSSFLLPVYPEVIAVLSQTDDSNKIASLAVLVLHQDAHRTSGHLLKLHQPLVVDSSTSETSSRELSFATGLMINRVLILPESELSTSSLRWQFWQLAQSNWREPLVAMDYFKLGLITPNLQEETVSDLEKWGGGMAKRARPLEVRSKKCSIGVSNTVGLSGLGKQYANFLAQQGATVRRVTNATTTLPNSQVLIDETSREDCVDMVPVISDLFSNQVPIAHQAGVTDQYRVPMMILLGSDSASMVGGEYKKEVE